MKNFVLLQVRGLASPGWLLALVLVLAGVRPALAQVPTSTNPYDVNPAAPPITRPDTATVRKVTKKEKRAQHAADSVKRTERLFGLHVTRPEKAGFLALIPSGGQIYNRKYWKLPIVYGMVGGLGYWVWYQQRYYSAFKYAKYNYNPNNPGKILNATKQIPDDKLRAQIATYSAANIENGLEGARSYLDLSILLSALGYSLQILDAVVDAHLHDFDVSDNLSINCRPTLLLVPGQLAPAGGLALTLRVK
jgi:hypothetical protein